MTGSRVKGAGEIMTISGQPKDERMWAARDENTTDLRMNKKTVTSGRGWSGVMSSWRHASEQFNIQLSWEWAQRSREANVNWGKVEGVLCAQLKVGPLPALGMCSCLSRLTWCNFNASAEVRHGCPSHRWISNMTWWKRTLSWNQISNAFKNKCPVKTKRTSLQRGFLPSIVSDRKVVTTQPSQLSWRFWLGWSHHKMLLWPQSFSLADKERSK